MGEVEEWMCSKYSIRELIKYCFLKNLNSICQTRQDRCTHELEVAVNARIRPAKRPIQGGRGAHEITPYPISYW